MYFIITPDQIKMIEELIKPIDTSLLTESVNKAISTLPISTLQSLNLEYENIEIQSDLVNNLSKIFENFSKSIQHTIVHSNNFLTFPVNPGVPEDIVNKIYLEAGDDDEVDFDYNKAIEIIFNNKESVLNNLFLVLNDLKIDNYYKEMCKSFLLCYKEGQYFPAQAAATSIIDHFVMLSMGKTKEEPKYRETVLQKYEENIDENFNDLMIIFNLFSCLVESYTNEVKPKHYARNKTVHFNGLSMQDIENQVNEKNALVACVIAINCLYASKLLDIKM